MTAAQQTVLIQKLLQLPPQRMTEVEDFVDFLCAREAGLCLVREAAATSQASFARVWDNDEDAIYDQA